MEKTVKKRKGTGGFTLVELIVVIAILAILAGVGTVAYTGYITATRKGVDRTLVGDLIYAAQLADYANPGLFDGSEGMIILSNESDAQVIGSSDSSAFSAALDDSVGDVSTLRLSYSDWGLDTSKLSARLSEIKQTFQDLGLYDEDSGTISEIGYADVADEYWAYMEDVVTGALGNTDIPEENFETLMVLTSYAVADQSDANTIGNAWASSDSSQLLNALQQTQYSNSTLASARVFASEGASYARNMAFARYLEKYGDYEGVDEDIAALKDLNNKNNLNSISSSEGYQTTLTEYRTGSGGNKSQAYVDGVAFYTFMSSINNQYGADNITIPANNAEVPTISNMPDNFWEDGASYVSWAASIGRGESSIAEMETALNNVTGNAVIILVDKTSGELEFQVSPADADPRDENSSTGDTVACSQTHTTDLTLTYLTGRPSGTIDGNTSGNVGTITLCSKDNAYSSGLIRVLNNSGSTQPGVVYAVSEGSDIISCSGGAVTALQAGTATITLTLGSQVFTVSVIVH